MMGIETVSVTVHGARGLTNLRHFSVMDPYVVASLKGIPGQTQEFKSGIARNGGTDPDWNFNTLFYFDKQSAQRNSTALHFQIRTHRANTVVRGIPFIRAIPDKVVGEATMTIEDLHKSAAPDGELTRKTCPVLKSGKPKGELHISYKCNDKRTPEDATPDHPAAPMALPAVSVPPADHPDHPATPMALPAVSVPPADQGNAQPPPPGNQPNRIQKAQLAVNAAGLIERTTADVFDNVHAFTGGF